MKWDVKKSLFMQRKDLNHIVKHDETTQVGHDRTEQVGRNETIHIGNDRMEGLDKMKTWLSIETKYAVLDVIESRK